MNDASENTNNSTSEHNIPGNGLDYVQSLLNEKKSYKGPCIVGIGLAAFGLLGIIIGLVWGMLRFFSNKSIDDQINNSILANPNIKQVEVSKLRFEKDNQLRQESTRGVVIGIILFIIIFIIVVIIVVVAAVESSGTTENSAINSVLTLSQLINLK